MSHKLYIDLETRSRANLRKVGAYRYAEDGSTEVHCLAWAVDDGPIHLWKRSDDLLGESPFNDLIGGTDPSAWMAHLLDPAYTVIAHNAEFERSIIREKFPHLDTPPERWDDTAARAARMSLPRSLEEAAKAAGLGIDEQKDTEGSRVMLKLARPRRASRENDDEFWHEDTKEDDFETLYEYCKQDVAVMRALDRRLPSLSEEERAIWLLTLRMNEKGVFIDRPAIPLAQTEVALATKLLTYEFESITGCSPSSPKARVALGMDSLNKASVREALKSATGPRKRALEIRKLVARSSVKKLHAIEDRISVRDGRVRGTLVYAGAERTLRWSGAGIQPQNFPRGMGKQTEEAFDALRAGVFSEAYEDVLKTVADMLRGFIVGPFLVGDFAQIEARVLAWLAGQEDLIQTFATGGDPYCEMASAIYGRTITKKDKDERFIGKTVILGCFSAETMVLTGRGWRPIVDVQATDTLWDGVEWVNHGGLLCQGEREVLCWRGIGVTPDHLVMTRAGWAPASQVVLGSGPLLESALASGSSAWKAIFSVGEEAWPRSAYLAAVTVPTSTRSILTTCNEGLPLRVTNAPSGSPPTPGSATGATPRSSLMTRIASGSSTESLPASAVATTEAPSTFPTTGDVESLFTKSGGKTEEPSSAISSPSTDGINQNSISTELTLTEGTSQEICASSPAVRTPAIGGPSPSSSRDSTASRKKCETYDLAFAGPRNRFMIYSDAGPLIVHNCGYGLGPEKFQAQLDTVYDVQVPLELAEDSIRTFRKRYSRIPALWTRLEGGFRYALTNRSKKIRVGPVAMGYIDGQYVPRVFIELPSGRRMYYARPEYRDGRVHYFGRNLYAGGRWEMVSTYGGKLTENVVQAVSRDLLAQAMLRLDRAGFPLVLTVHDEVVAEGSKDRLEEFERLLVEVPTWAKGLPLGVEAFHCQRYHK